MAAEAPSPVAPGLRPVLRFAAICNVALRIFASFLRWGAMSKMQYAMPTRPAPPLEP